jgi:hypothetical protein
MKNAQSAHDDCVRGKMTLLIMWVRTTTYDLHADHATYHDKDVVDGSTIITDCRLPVWERNVNDRDIIIHWSCRFLAVGAAVANCGYKTNKENIIMYTPTHTLPLSIYNMMQFGRRIMTND